MSIAELQIIQVNFVPIKFNKKMETDKKKRSPNYTIEEKENLLSIVTKYKSIIDCKKTGAFYIQKKKEAWLAIRKEYNSICTTGPRDEAMLKHFYNNIKHRARKVTASANKQRYLSELPVETNDVEDTQRSDKPVEVEYSVDENVPIEEVIKDLKIKWNDEKKNIKKTGGGSYDPILTDADHQILSIMDDHIHPDENPYDDAAEYFASFIQPCSASDPQLDRCIENVIRSAGPRFAAGVPGLGIAPLDPLELDVVTVNNPSLRLNFTDASVDGLRAFRLNYYRINLPKGRAVLDFTANVTLKGHYVMDGKILIMPIKGNGEATIKITNLNINLKYEFEIRDGHWVVPGYTSTHKMERAHFQFSNLFNGNKILGDIMHKILDDNWEPVIRALSPEVVQQIIQACVDESKKLFAHAPVEELLLP